ncbi:MAG: redoxin domain-containing protein [Pirellulales bacterium]|nr:redoxin domain-containing protein [Pirellulales bacterium]
MRSRLLLPCLTLAAAMATMQAPALAAGLASETVGKSVANFKLQDFYGQDHQLSDLADKKAVVLVFLGTECPLAKLYAPRLQELADTYAKQGVAMVGIMSNRQDSITEIGAFARRFKLKFPILKDTGNTVADAIGAQRTPEVFLLDANRVVRYSGRIDDQYGLTVGSGYAQPKVRVRYLADAIEQVLAGKPVALASTETAGCLIGRVREVKADSEITYSNQVARILQKNCVECHRAGQIAPFSLTDYSEVAGWADMIAEVVRDGRMPPWHADTRFGHFQNDRSMSPEDKETLFAWVANGAPEGDPGQLPEPIEYAEGWQMGEPDEVIYMSDKPYKVQAEGTIDYQYFLVDPGWKEDRWIKGSECLLGNREVVHHIFVFAVPPGIDVPDFQAGSEGGARRDREDGFNPGAGGVELIAGAAPGTPPWMYKDDMGTHLKAGTRLVFQMHYTACGREVEDRSAVGFRWAKPGEIKHNVAMNMAINFGFKIPAGANEHPVEAQHSFKQDTLLLTFAPHMHLRGKSFKYDLRYPDGHVETLLSVPRYDFNWQVIYMLKEPLLAPAGSTLECYATFDNSEDNLANPDPTQDVRWGDQTWEEMMIGWFSQSTDVDPSQLPAGQSRTARFLAEVQKQQPKVSGLLKKAAAGAANSDIDCMKFLNRLQREVPQIDRICVTVVEENLVRVAAVAQPPVFEYQLGTSGEEFDLEETAFNMFAASPEPTMIPDLTGAQPPDLARMADVVRSSYHVPITLGGRPASVNFWSKETNAFPPEATGLLQELAKLVGTAKPSTKTKANDTAKK